MILVNRTILTIRNAFEWCLNHLPDGPLVEWYWNWLERREWKQDVRWWTENGRHVIGGAHAAIKGLDPREAWEPAKDAANTYLRNYLANHGFEDKLDEFLRDVKEVEDDLLRSKFAFWEPKWNTECECGRDNKGGLTLHDDGTMSFHGGPKCYRVTPCEHIHEAFKTGFIKGLHEVFKGGKCIKCGHA